MNSSITSLLLTVGLWAALTVLCCAPRSETQELTDEQRQAIDSALQSKELPAPKRLEMSDIGWIVATYEVQDRSEARPLAESAVLTIREAMLRFKFKGHYRVTVNGSSPGTGLILRYGSARFTDRLEWESGLDF